MRIVLLFSILVSVAGLGARAAADCDAKAKPIYTREQKPLHAGSGTAKSFAITASGAWTRDGAHGCLAPARAKLVEDAIAKATFKTNDKARRCRVAAVWQVTIAAPARSLSVQHDEPCGVPFDAATSAMIACADAVVDASVTDDAAAKACTAP